MHSRSTIYVSLFAIYICSFLTINSQLSFKEDFFYFAYEALIVVPTIIFCFYVLREFKNRSTDVQNLRKNQKQKLDELDIKLAMLNEAIMNVPYPVFIFDSNFLLVVFNSEANRCFLENATTSLYGKHIDDLFRDGRLSSCLDGVNSHSGSFRHLSASAVEMQIDYRLLKINHYVLLFVEDRIQQVLAEKIQSDFSSNLSHELRTPLTALKGYTETLSDHCRDDEFATVCLSSIQRAVDRFQVLTDSFILLSRLESDAKINDKDIELFAADKLIRDVVSNLDFEDSAKRFNIQIEGEIVISANRHLLDIAVTNILTNAINHSGVNKPIEISVKEESTNIEISITDFGKGIPQENLNRVFERFYRVDTGRSSDQGGIGLGLAIVKKIIDVNGGSIFVESKMGSGACFTIKLPAGTHKL